MGAGAFPSPASPSRGTLPDVPNYTITHAMDRHQTPLGVLHADPDGTITGFTPADADHDGMFYFEIAGRETVAHAASHLRLYHFVPHTPALNAAIADARANRRGRSPDADSNGKG